MVRNRVRKDEVVIDRSGDAASMVNSETRHINVTRTNQTPANDPLVVEASALMQSVQGPIAVNIQNGATVVIGGNWKRGWSRSSIKINGGTIHLRSDLSRYAADGLAIMVGPDGGKIEVDQHLPSEIFLKRTVQFVDKRGHVTSEIPENFAVNFLNASSVVGAYLKARDVTLIGDGASHKLNASQRVLTIKGDPFHLEQIGSPIPKGGFVGDRKYIHTFLQSDGVRGVIACYLSGSEVQIPGGRICVEDLREGMEVLVRDPTSGVERCERVVWVGKGVAHVREGLPDDEAGWPVKILRHAFGDNVPYKDMCVTPEHCFFLNGVFVPVRMLVNGASIFYDKSQRHYDHWHFETACHEVIDVDGALTETFLNTGHDYPFVQEDGGADAPTSPVKSWETDAAAPLETRREVIEPLYHSLCARAHLRGLPVYGAACKDITADPNLTLWDEQGRALPLIEKQGARYIFGVHGDVKNVTLVSRTSRPCDAIGPYIDDRRALGVLVGEVWLYREDGSSEPVSSFLNAPSSDGWDVQEQGPWRWTNGRARIFLPIGHKAGVFLSVDVKAGGPYVLDDLSISSQQYGKNVQIVCGAREGGSI